MHTCGYKNFPERKSREHAREKKGLFQQHIDTTEGWFKIREYVYVLIHESGIGDTSEEQIVRKE